MARVAVLGTGIMGAPIARRLAAAGHEVRAWKRSAEKVPPEVERAGTPAEAVAGADAIVTMLADGPAVEAVMADVGRAAGTPWLQMSTVGVGACERLAALAAARRLVLVDTPVLGSKPQAEAGELVALAACPAGARGRVAPLLEAIARRVVWLDGPCEGSRLKILVNAWILCCVENLAETLALARAVDLEPGRFFDAIEGMAFDMAYARVKGAQMLEGSYAPAFPLRLARKDLALAVEAAAELDLPVLRAALARFEAAVALGAGDEDAAAVARVSGFGG